MHDMAVAQPCQKQRDFVESTLVGGGRVEDLLSPNPAASKL